jgi:hypothetical protein
MKINKKNILFIIPAFNEAEVIGSVIKPIVNKGYNVLVIDDCSSLFLEDKSALTSYCDSSYGRG